MGPFSIFRVFCLNRRWKWKWVTFWGRQRRRAVSYLTVQRLSLWQVWLKIWIIKLKRNKDLPPIKNMMPQSVKSTVNIVHVPWMLVIAAQNCMASAAHAIIAAHFSVSVSKEIITIQKQLPVWTFVEGNTNWTILPRKHILNTCTKPGGP